MPDGAYYKIEQYIYFRITYFLREKFVDTSREIVDVIRVEIVKTPNAYS